MRQEECRKMGGKKRDNVYRVKGINEVGSNRPEDVTRNRFCL
jgi:hypothetical protein